MSSHLSSTLLVVLFLTATVYGQDSANSDPSVNAEPPLETTIKTSGIVGAIVPYLWPINTLLYQTLDSVLRNVKNESLPCTIYDFTSMDIECTPL